MNYLSRSLIYFTCWCSRNAIIGVYFENKNYSTIAAYDKKTPDLFTDL